MPHAIVFSVSPLGKELRPSLRTAHVAYITKHLDMILASVGFYDNEDIPCGGLLILDTDDRSVAEKFVEDDPFHKARIYGELGTKAAARRMKTPDADGRSRLIVNLACMNAIFEREDLSHYAASKHGVLGLTKGAAREFGADDFQVHAVAPAMVSTPGLAALNKTNTAEEVKAVEDMVKSRLPLGRICVPDDVARVVAFCASDIAAMMSGSMVLVDVGFATG